MQLKKIVIGGLAAVTAASGLLATTVTAASADPVRPYAAAGSDTIQAVWNGLTNDFGAVAPSIASYDAFVFPPAGVTSGFASYIQTKTGGAWLRRPSGSGDGQKVLSDVWDPAYTSHGWPGTDVTGAGATSVVLNHEDIDFARSSSGPASGTGLKYLPFARDAVSIAYNPTGSLGSGLNLTTGELQELYSGVDDTSNNMVTFSAQPATASTQVFLNTGTQAAPVFVQVHPKIPQSGSGTRKFFLTTGLGLSNSVGALAPYISDPGDTAHGGLPENDGSALVNDGDLIPFSAAQWIAQGNGKSTDTTAGLALASINGAGAVTGVAPTLAPGALYGAKNVSGKYNTVPATTTGTFNRDTYDIVPTAFLTGTAKQQALVTILGAGINGSAGAAVIQAFGFGVLSYGGNSANFLDGAYAH